MKINLNTLILLALLALAVWYFFFKEVPATVTTETTNATTGKKEVLTVELPEVKTTIAAEIAKVIRPTTRYIGVAKATNSTVTGQANANFTGPNRNFWKGR